MCKLLVFVLAGAVVVAASSEPVEVGHGFQILGKIARQYLNSQPEDLKISDGFHIINTRSENDARANTDDGTVVGALENYLQSHEVRIKLQELLPGEGFGRAFKEAMAGSDVETGRGKGGKGGMGGIMMMGMMMGKMMAVLGLAMIAGLASKALMVSLLALMLSTIIGLKKLVSGSHDEGGHHVIHASPHGHEHRRKREASDMAYSAWRHFNSS